MSKRIRVCIIVWLLTAMQMGNFIQYQACTQDSLQGGSKSNKKHILYDQRLDLINVGCGHCAHSTYKPNYLQIKLVCAASLQQLSWLVTCKVVLSNPLGTGLYTKSELKAL